MARLTLRDCKEIVLGLLNAPLRRLGVELVPSWRLCWWMHPAAFEFAGRQFDYFFHPYNCGWPPYVSERSVELSLANVWLGALGSSGVVEIGAVTPYYWPGRVRSVIDPYDPHPLVTTRDSLFNVDLSGRSVLSISTFEHIGMGDYGIDESPEQVREALDKLLAESPRFLVTVPVGYNKILDQWPATADSIPSDVSLRYAVRQSWSTWTGAKPGEIRSDLGDPALQRRFPGTCIGRWANSLAVLERGGII